MLMVGDEVTGLIERIAFGGSGIMRHEGMVVFVPFTVPGETVRVRIVLAKKTFRQAELLEILSPSVHRVQPRCRHYGVCGGCQLMHMDADSQREAKRQFVADALKRVGRMTQLPEVRMMPSGDNWAYRRQIKLHVRRLGKRQAIGMVGVDHQALVEIEECPIFVDESPASIIKNARSTLKANQTTVSLYKGESEVVMELGDCKFSGNFSAFLQNHETLSLQLYRDVLDMIVALNPTRVLDLYCGIGVMSVLLAGLSIDVQGVELSEEAVRLARLNAKKNGVQPVFHASAVDKILASLLRESFPDVVLLNPPRTGLDDVTRQILAESDVKYLLYVSCMPATLARDLQALIAQGYQLKTVQAYDMFPQTTHVETLILLAR